MKAAMEAIGLSVTVWVCPEDGTELTFASGKLRCAQGHCFRVRNGIPRFAFGQTYAEAFGLQWKKYRQSQLDSYSGTSISSDRVKRCLGDELWDNLADKEVLECGCGAGRFTEILLSRGACVTSVDLSDAVDACADNCPLDRRHRIAQADIEKLPFKPRQFDVVFCLGVIQHTPNPEHTIAKLYEQVKPGGSLVIDHYTANLSWYTKTAPLFRQVLKRLSPERGLRCTEWLVNVFLPWHKKVKDVRWAQMLLSRVSPVLCYYRAYPELNDGLQKEWALIDTHDSLTDWFKWFCSPHRIRKTLTGLGLKEINVQAGGNGVEARGIRPVFDPARKLISNYQ